MDTLEDSMGKIFCLMGKSSSGKDTIFKELKEDKKLNLKPVVPYTTRPKRSNEINGVEYHFIDKETLSEYRDKGKVIEEREYNTIEGKWYYCTLDDGQIDLDKNDYIIIVTLEAYKKLQNYFGNENIIPIYVNIDDGIRLERALKREMQQESPNYDELCRRFLADNNDFSLDNLNEYGIDKDYKNYDLNECIKMIKVDILNLRY